MLTHFFSLLHNELTQIPSNLLMALAFTVLMLLCYAVVRFVKNVRTPILYFIIWSFLTFLLGRFISVLIKYAIQLIGIHSLYMDAFLQIVSILIAGFILHYVFQKHMHISRFYALLCVAISSIISVISMLIFVQFMLAEFVYPNLDEIKNHLEAVEKKD